MQKRQTLERVEEEIAAIPIVNSHEHIRPAEKIRTREVDLWDFFANCYVNADFVSAGFPGWVREGYSDPEVGWEEGSYDPEAAWKDMREWLPRVRNTAYFRALMLAFRELFDFPATQELDDANWRELNEKLNAANKRPDWYGYVLKERANIATAIWDGGRQTFFQRDHLHPDREFFVPVLRIDDLIEAQQVSQRTRIEEKYGAKAHTLDDYLDLLDTAFQEVLEAGGVGIKSGSAYRRIIHYAKVPRAEAERVFSLRSDDIGATDAKAFQDFMMHEVLKRCAEYGLPMQIHTGFQAGNGNVLSNSNPLHLTNLLLEYGDVKFDIFHGSYPFTGELAVLAKTFPNVYLNACWLSFICPAENKRALHEWIETVPGSKILAWGGDCRRVEATYGSLLVARPLIAEVLAEKVEAGYFGLEVALELAHQMLRDNGVELFGLELGD